MSETKQPHLHSATHATNYVREDDKKDTAGKGGSVRLLALENGTSTGTLIALDDK